MTQDEICGLLRQIHDVLAMQSETNHWAKPVAEQEPVAWKWHKAPVKTQWGDDMVVADIDIDKDHMVSVYCERDQKTRVEAMFTTPPQRTWVGLTDEEIKEIIGPWGDTPIKGYTRKLFDQIEAKLRSKNT
jgi:hypothetical protein